MDAFLYDLRHAARTIRRSPGFAAVAVLSLTLGIGANTTIFSVANAVLLQPLRAADPGRLVRIYRGHHSPLTYPDFAYFRDHSRVFSHVIGERLTNVGLVSEGRVERYAAALVSGDYFPALGVRAQVGRVFATRGDSASEGGPVAVLSDRTWRSRFGADPGVVGRTVRLNNRAFTIIGVAEPGFHSSVFGWRPDLWVPFGDGPVLVGTPLERWGGSLYVVARLAPNVDAAQANAELSVIMSRLAREVPEGHERMTVRLDHARGVNAEVRLPLIAASTFLMFVVGLVLLIACANVANLLLARATARRREVGVRLALGASRGRLVRQLLTESVLLAGVGGGLGLAVSVWATRLLATFIPADQPVGLDFAPDRQVLAYTLVVSVATGLLFGLAPALQATRPELVSSLKDEGTARGYRRSRLRNSLVGVQAALCMVCLAGASLFLRSLAHARELAPGFEASRVLDVPVDVSLRQYDEARGRAFYERLVEQSASLPTVRSAALAHLVPLAGSNMQIRMWLPGDAPDARRGDPPYFNIVGPGYLRTLDIPLLRGREFASDDREGAPRVIVVNETFARRYWPGEDPLGKRLSVEGPQGPWMTVVGVAKDARYNSLGERDVAFFYLPFAQHYRAEMNLQLRTEGDPRAIRAAALDVVRSLDPLLPPPAAKPIAEDVAIALIPARIGASLLGAFGALALVLATMGIYGVTSYAVAQRTREIGIRSALGARGRDVLRLVLGETLRLVAIGGAIGLAMAYGVGKVAASQLYDVSAADPATFVGTPLILGTVALLAGLVPARRAVRVDPMVALRYD